MKIVTWNLRCLWKATDGVNAFIHRAGFIYDKIMQEKPSVIAFQEVIPDSLELLKRTLPEYEFFGSFRTEKYDQEGLFVAFLKDEFTLLGADVFWLSPTPYVAGSRFENQSEYPRVCAYAKLLCKKTFEILNVFDLHLDHISDEAKKLGLGVVFEYIEKRQDSVDKNKTIILGDFNAYEDSETLRFVREKSWLVDSTKGIGVTYHDFETEECCHIDYIFISKALGNRIEKVETWLDEHCGIYLSDHYPVCLELTNESEE